ncbi:beta-lactamase [Fimbriimonas ginsengisoli Gsoil 348]|uniref:Beta-lactamase n=1 Tax=Fimbriimonas ginsengisoli Gsoil 348 TaxID=661478 RepID=A0A068NL81_FIMGI|nr:beta-lactamase [Fimbriimonas ginsengisoli Gsoil 348]
MIEGPDGLVLIDTGLGTQDIMRPKHRIPGPILNTVLGLALDQKETAITQVRALGLHPRDVRHIVLTHLDFDHAGGLADFPEAQVHVFTDELHNFLNSANPIDMIRYSQEQIAHQPDWEVHELEGERWMEFEAVRAMTVGSSDILLVPLAGHTRGHCGVAIRAGDGWILHSGDALFDLNELDPEGRHLPVGLRTFENMLQYDREKRIQNVERLRELKKAHGDSIHFICSHDPDGFEADAADGIKEFASTRIGRAEML